MEKRLFKAVLLLTIFLLTSYFIGYLILPDMSGMCADGSGFVCSLFIPIIAGFLFLPPILFIITILFIGLLLLIEPLFSYIFNVKCDFDDRITKTTTTTIIESKYLNNK
jgi:Ni,Fe-hydrogenase I cytochrome b subunit